MEKKYGVWAVRSAASIFGAAQSWCKENGHPLEFDTMAEAERYAEEMNASTRSANVHYHAKEKESEQSQENPSVREHLRTERQEQEARQNKHFRERGGDDGREV